MGARRQIWSRRTARGGDGLLGIRISAILLFYFWVLASGCQAAGPKPPAPGRIVAEKETYDRETGKVTSRSKVEVHQNEAPEGETVVRADPESGELEVVFSRSWRPEIPDRLAHVELVVAGAGVVVLLLGALFAGIGRHWRLAGLAAVCSMLLFGIAATIDRYAWAYGMGVIAVFSGIGWLTWSAYKAALNRGEEDV